MSPQATEEFDLWEPSVGGFSEYEGVISEARFGYDAAYNSGNSLVLMLTVDVDPSLGAPDDQRHELYTVGNGWEEAEDGETCQNAKGELGGTVRGARYNDQGGCGLLMNALKTSDGFKPGIVKNPYLASAYVGLGVEFEGVAFEKTIGGEKVEYTRTLPIRVWRDGDAAKPATKAATAGKKASAGGAKKAAATKATTETPAQAAKRKAAERKAAAAAEAEGDDGASELPGMDEVKALAAECSDYDTFVERAYGELEVVIESEELQAWVDEPENFTF